MPQSSGVLSQVKVLKTGNWLLSVGNESNTHFLVRRVFTDSFSCQCRNVSLKDHKFQNSQFSLS